MTKLKILLHICIIMYILDIILFALIYQTGIAGKTSRQKKQEVQRTEFEGHYYVRFSDPDTGEFSMVHDPDCPCLKKLADNVKYGDPFPSEWETLQMAIAMTESRFNPLAKGKAGDLGILQETPIYVKEANRLLGYQAYVHEDAYDINKSLEMFNIIQGYHNKGRDIERAIHLHNKGASNAYCRKVLDNMEFIRRMEAVRSAIILNEN